MQQTQINEKYDSLINYKYILFTGPSAHADQDPTHYHP